MFCQSCGAANADEARFCNMCGSHIAKAGEPGGPVASAAVAGDAPAAAPVAAAYAKTEEAPQVSTAAVNPPSSAWAGSRAGAGGSETLQGAPSPYSSSGAGGGPSMMDVSLASIGVRSNKKGFAVVLGVAVILLGVGAGASYLLTGSGADTAPVGSAEATDPFVIGTPLPEGANTPDVDIVSGGESGSGATGTPSMDTRPSGQGGRRPAQPTRTTRPHRHGASTAMTSGMATMTTATMTTATMTTVTMTTATTMTGTMDTASNGGAGGGTDTTGAGSAGTNATDMSAGGGSGGSTAGTGGAGGGSLPTDAPEESDIELDMYGARVRFVVRRYYAARARSCFDRATRNNPGVSGTVIVNMTINASGQVGHTSVARNTTGDTTLGACLAGQVGQWRLPPPPGGELQMQMPFSR